mmetsp:Transcript_53971/g.66151  ORF Transcript_53971/g.66151 Transcript_53971/m.66151 type:complete len:216 (+) Transcript_53971:40-687(+)
MAQSSDDPTKVVVTPKTIYIAKPKQNTQDTSNNDDSSDLALASGIIFIDDIFELSPMKREKAVKLVSKIFKNIIDNPNEPKFRRINASKINSKFPMQVIQLLQAAGFEQDSTSNDHSILPNNKLNLIQGFNNILLDKLEEQQRIQDEQRRQIMEDNKKKMAKWKQNNDNNRSAIKQKLNNAKKDKDYKPSVKSVAKKRKFGATHVKVEFKSTKGG